MRTTEFVGQASDDHECFCWAVDEQTYRRFRGDRLHDSEQAVSSQQRSWPSGS